MIKFGVGGIEKYVQGIVLVPGSALAKVCVGGIETYAQGLALSARFNLGR